MPLVRLSSCAELLADNSVVTHIVCRWRTAADAAAERTELHLTADTLPAFFSPAVTSLAARHWASLALDLSGAAYVRAPAFRAFLASCGALRRVTAYAGEPDDAQLACVEEALCDQAVAASPCILEYACVGFLPGALPPQLRRLAVTLDSAASLRATAAPLELLAVRLQPLTALAELHLELSGFRTIELRAEALAGLALPRLHTLRLCFQLLRGLRLDLGWLGLPRAFVLHLSVGDRLSCAAPWSVDKLRDRLLRALQVGLHSGDSLCLTRSRDSLTEPEQQQLASLCLAGLHLRLPPQTVTQLPAAESVSLEFEGDSGRVCELTWFALQRCTGRVSVDVCRAVPQMLRVLGFDHCLPAGRPWMLCVSGARQLEGLPAVTACEPCMLRNRAALQAGWV